ncbi:hypothetical protein A7Y00_06540 [Stenotrophomonas maltophilia]|uniref:Uncharacterized protein n=3 Tax=Stenotrophomonas TaxID=40323 RepID=A0AAW3SAD1_STEMA|nr:hypothetical protein L681_00570 [Stenotrophomonas maltophilia MF89]KOO79005.1 hypothetical protein VO93_10610 [Stenotrophomonas maltophilia]MRI42225.1 hypothetical protein [Stenotrophomonas sp. MH181796]KWV48625.1 hypothetical protein AS591_13425 [Stenotrophomonas maltophilia]MBA0287217.1 hypothetical protein [Stenotrophomonas maltophilia]
MIAEAIAVWTGGEGKAIVCKRLDDPAMSILNVLLTRDHLVVAADTLAEDALTGAYSAGAKLLLIPQHNVVLAARGSTQFFLGGSQNSEKIVR